MKFTQEQVNKMANIYEEYTSPLTIEEEWREVQGYGSKYEVSNLGRVRRHTGDKVKVMNKWNNGGGYQLVCLYHINGQKKVEYVHRLIAQAFIPNPNNLSTVNHIDHNKHNNRVKNLEWMTLEDNIADGRRKKVKCEETGEIFESVKEVSKALGYVEDNAVGFYIRHNKKAKGLTFSYIN